MGEPLKSTHVRLTAAADAVLGSLADLADKDKAEIARQILEEALLGKAHTLKLLVERHKRLGARGIEG